MRQYYTQESVAELMIEQIRKDIAPVNIADICSGSWNLLKQAYKIWKNVKLYGTDINPETINNVIGGNFFSCMDGRDFALECIKNNLNFELLLANPPFKRGENNHMNYHSLPGYDKMSKQALERIETSMLLANLALVKESGILAAIIPETIINGNWALCLRSYFLNNCEIKSIIFLPSDAFGRDIFTAIIILKKIKANNEKIIIYDAIKQDKGLLSLKNKRIINGLHFLDGMSTNNKKQNQNSIDFCIVRGNISNCTLSKRKIGLPVIHTTDIKNMAKIDWVPLNRCEAQTSNRQLRLAKYNDILVIRVGRNCGQFGIMKSQKSIPVTDCVFIIKTKSKWYAQKVWDFLNSKEYSEKLQSIKRGVTTRYVAKSDLIGLIQENIKS